MEHVLEVARFLPMTTAPATTGREALAATIRAAAAGDQDACSRLYADYVRLVHAILLGRIPRRDVDDLVQEVFIAAYTRIGELRDPAAFGGWIATIARNRATDHLRQSHEQVELPDELPGGDPIEAETMAVLDTVRKLPEAYRETLLMRLVGGVRGGRDPGGAGPPPPPGRGKLPRGVRTLRG